MYDGHKGNRGKYLTRKRSKIGNRRPPNRHSFEDDSEYVSASAKKLKMKDGKCDREVDESFGYRFINFLTVFSAISQVVVCRECKGDVTFSECSSAGLAPKLL